MKLHDFIGKHVSVSILSCDEEGEVVQGVIQGILSGVEGTMIYFDVIRDISNEEEKKNVWLNTSSLFFNGMTLVD
ncbi:MAG: hypothetical protein AAB726_01640 [Patescibacteria group bacterium]